MDQVNFDQAVKTVRGSQEVVNLSTKMLRSALGYPDDHGPSTLAILVQEICEDHAEKTVLLQRVEAYLDKLDALNKERRVTSKQQKALFDELLKPENNPDCNKDLKDLFNWRDN